ncbi:hypothetical protein POM88_029827 [Heracleum sosnowskyi]|uniref:TTF-type domain-containing protein n=1 Tax=Heracleum sosnowskyi TaxID=360622 RepID=A0AAD8HVM0_9APIA|nr:hypothetical protein POM88_029827 [Heracleum sosnowskyi]
MDKYVIKKPRISVNFVPTPTPTPTLTLNPTPNPSVESDTDTIVSDPGSRKQIKEYDVGIRDRIRREYISKGVCQPFGHNFPKTTYGKSTRTFRDKWFKKYDWLEYSISKDAVFCFYCFLFKPDNMIHFGDDAFTKVGFKNWKNACEKLRDHVGEIGSPHHNARILYEGFKWRYLKKLTKM